MTLSGFHSVKVLSTTVGYLLVAMVSNLCCHLTYDSRGAWHKMYAMLLSNYNVRCTPTGIRIIVKCDFLKSLIHSQMIYHCMSTVVSALSQDAGIYIMQCKNIHKLYQGAESWSDRHLYSISSFFSFSFRCSRRYTWHCLSFTSFSNISNIIYVFV